MGWTFSSQWQTKDAIRDYLRKGLTHGLQADRTVGNTLYLLDGKGNIIVCLLGKERNYGWGYKDMDETMVPCEASCPDALLDKACETTNEGALKWRSRCREYNEQKRSHARMLRSIKPGDTLHLHEGCFPRTLRVVSTEGKIRASYGGQLFRVAPRHIFSVDSEDAA